MTGFLGRRVEMGRVGYALVISQCGMMGDEVARLRGDEGCILSPLRVASFRHPLISSILRAWE